MSHSFCWYMRGTAQLESLPFMLCRRKFRSQTSDNMERWKSVGGKSQRREENKKEDQRRERVRGKKMQVREKVEKSRNHVLSNDLWLRRPSSWKFYNTLTFFCSLLARCRVPCACHAKPHLNLQKWSEHVVFLHLDVETCFSPQRRALFQHRNFQKCSEREVLSTFWLRNVLRATTACTFSSSQLPKVVWESIFFHCWLRNVLCATTACKLSSLISPDGSAPDALASLLFDPFEEDLERCISHGRRSARDMFIRDVRRSGRWFPERGCILSIRSSGLLRWFCVTGAALRMTWHHFCGQAQHFREMQWKNRETYWYEAVSSALSFPLLKEVLQNCLVFDLVNFENWRKSRRIASFLTLSS